MRILIVDDEPLARTALADILSARSDIEHFESASDAIEAKERLARENYDVILLDINMPELSGLELLDDLKRIEQRPPSVIFVTAYAKHAIAAFERHAVDYVLKPFAAERVNRALEFASRRTASERAERLLEVLPDLKELSQKRFSQIGIKSSGRIVFIDPNNVVVVEAEGNYVLLQQESGSDLLREPISAVAEKLKAYGFVRIHRSVLVNAAFVKEIRPSSAGEYLLRLKSGKEYTVTRNYKSNLKSLAEHWIGTHGWLE
jgi:two-component system, LytTR family, response regulator